MNAKITVLVLASLLSLPCFGQEATTSAPPRASFAARLGQQREIVMRTASTRAIDLLVLLRAGDTTEAIERLEQEIDAAICTTWDKIQSGPPEEQKERLQFLSTLKEYREKHPEGSKGSNAAKAKDILEKLGKERTVEPANP
jgi:hypothetical protein